MYNPVKNHLLCNRLRYDVAYKTGGNMVIINDKKISLIAKLIISYLVLLAFAFLFYVFNTDPSSDQTARGAVFTNLLVWSATIFTPIAAYFFYDSWKDQKNYELKKELMIKLSELVSTQYIKITKYARMADRLKHVKEYEIRLPSFYKSKHSYDSDLLNEIFSILEIYEGFSSDSSLKKYKNTFDTSAFALSVFLRNIERKYDEYAKKLEFNLDDNRIQSKSYTVVSRQKVDRCIIYIEIEMDKKLDFETIDINGVVSKNSITYDEAHDNFDKAYKDFLKQITEKMKA